VTWQIVVAMRVLLANVLFPFLNKKVARLPWVRLRLLMQFAMASVLAIIIAVCLRTNLEPRVFILIGVGVASSFATYCQWKANSINVSQTGIVNFWDDLIPMAAAYFFLGEGKFLNRDIGIGTLVSLLGIILLARESNGKWSRQFYLYVAGYSLIWGGTNFLMRLFALNNVSFGNFLVGWYCGGVVGSLINVFIFKEPEIKKTDIRLQITDALGILVLAVVIVASLVLGYQSFHMAPVLVLQSIYMVCEIIFVSLTGMFLLGEHKEFKRRELFYYALAGAGAITVATSF